MQFSLCRNSNYGAYDRDMHNTLDIGSKGIEPNMQALVRIYQQNGHKTGA